jgi:hypothetical protein
MSVMNVYILVTEPVEPFGSTLYLFGQLRSFGSVGDRHNVRIMPIGRSYLYTLLVAYYLYYTSILSIRLGTLAVLVY